MFELVTGASSSGKSEYAEKRALELCGEGEPLIYLASMEPDCEEARKKIERHRKQREGKGFQTIERYTDYVSLELPENATVLLECLSNLLANEMFDVGGDYLNRVEAGIVHIARNVKNLVVVTDDLFSDGCVYHKETAEYLKSLALINIRAADEAERIVNIFSSFVSVIKGIL